MKSDFRKEFNTAGRVMVKKFKDFFPHWNQFDHTYGMLDPSDHTRMNDMNDGNIPSWEYIYKLPDVYSDHDHKRICSVY